MKNGIDIHVDKDTKIKGRVQESKQENRETKNLLYILFPTHLLEEAEKQNSTKKNTTIMKPTSGKGLRGFSELLFPCLPESSCCCVYLSLKHTLGQLYGILKRTPREHSSRPLIKKKDWLSQSHREINFKCWPCIILIEVFVEGLPYR